MQIISFYSTYKVYTYIYVYLLYNRRYTCTRRVACFLCEKHPAKLCMCVVMMEYYTRKVYCCSSRVVNYAVCQLSNAEYNLLLSSAAYTNYTYTTHKKRQLRWQKIYRPSSSIHYIYESICIYTHIYDPYTSNEISSIFLQELNPPRLFDVHHNGIYIHIRICHK